MAAALALPQAITDGPTPSQFKTPKMIRRPSTSSGIDFLSKLEQAEQRDTLRASQRKDPVQKSKELRAHAWDQEQKARSAHKEKYIKTMSAAAERKEASLNFAFEERKKRNLEKQQRAEKVRQERLKQVLDRQNAWRRAHQSTPSRTPSRPRPSTPA